MKEIVCSPKNAAFVLGRYAPKRLVEVSSYCEDHFFYVLRLNKKGVFAVKLADMSVWVPDEPPYFKRWHLPTMRRED